MKEKWVERTSVPVELARKTARSIIGDAYRNVWKSNIIALIGECGACIEVLEVSFGLRVAF